MLHVLIFVSAVLVILLLTMAMNLLIFPKLGDEDTPSERILISILIPARNEADVIAQTINLILRQDYEHFELLVLDDHSEDGTGEILRQMSQRDERLKIFRGSKLPSGWIGKSWACHQLADHAAGDILVFTDADVQWQTPALSSIIAQMQRTNVDMLTVWSTQITETFAERFSVPLMAMAILGYLPTVMVHHSPFSIFAAANGQCMAWRREAYEAIGGHQAVANNVLDDVTLAKLAKKQGFRIRMVDGAGQMVTRMYDDWNSVRDGFAKNMLAGYGNSVPLLVFGIVFHWLVFVIPYVLVFLPQYQLSAGIVIIAGLVLRMSSAVFTRQRAIDAVLLPVSVMLFTVIAFQAIYWHYTGGVTWKGRKLGQESVE